MEEMSIGKHIRNLRKNKGYSIVQLSEISGVSNPYISQIENDKFKPSPEILEKLSQGLDVDYYKLMEVAGYIEEGDLKLIFAKYSELISSFTHIDKRITSITEEQQLLSVEITKIVKSLEKLPKGDVNSAKSLSEKSGALLDNINKLSAELDNLFIERQAIYEEKNSVEKALIKIQKLNNDLSEELNKKVSLDEILSDNEEVYFYGKLLDEEQKKRVFQSIQLILYLK